MGAFADPDNWAIGSWEFDWVNANVIRDRAQNIAHAANKPFIIEETGTKVPPLHPTLSEVLPCAINAKMTVHSHLEGSMCSQLSNGAFLQYLPSWPAVKLMCNNHVALLCSERLPVQP